MSPELQDDGSYIITARAEVDADGSPNAYGPHDSGLDWTANAGHPGDWWGILTDNGKPSGSPVIGPNGKYISTTSLRRDGQYIDAEQVPFMVVPEHWALGVPGIVLGCAAQVTDIRTKISIPLVAGDIGPGFGEISIAACKALGIPFAARNGGCGLYVFEYRIWPGIAAPGFTLQRLIQK